MARSALPQSKLKMRKRRRRVRLAFVVLLGIFVLAGGVVGLLHAPFWRIMHIDVSGTQSVSSELLVGEAGQMLLGSYLYVIPKDNILFYPKRSIIIGLKARFPALSTITISRTGLTSLSMHVSEYGPYALWCGKSPDAPEPCFLMDKSGAAYAPAVSYSGSAYVRYYGALSASDLPQQYFSVEGFRMLDALLAQIAQKAQGSLVSVALDESGDVHANFANGFQLIFSSKDNAAQTLQRFTLALTAAPFKGHALSEFAYLDLRFGDKLYYKLH